MVADPHEIILDHLRAIRAELGEIKADVRDLKESQLNTRDQLNAMQRDGLRQERAFTAIELDLERIKARLDLADLPQ